MNHDLALLPGARASGRLPEVDEQPGGTAGRRSSIRRVGSAAAAALAVTFACARSFAQASPVQPTASPQTPPAPQSVVHDPPGRPIAVSPPFLPGHPGLFYTGVGLGVGGLVGLLSGAYWLATAPPPCSAQSYSYEVCLNSSRLAWFPIGIGIAAMAVSLPMVLVGASSRSPPAHATMVPTPIVGPRSATLRWTF
jgi:hypothetical protein